MTPVAHPSSPPFGQAPGRTSWVVVVPVKDLGVAKSRLVGLAAADRAELSLAMARDVVAAARDADVVSGVVVVTNDLHAAEVLDEDGARVVPDSPAEGIDAALLEGGRTGRGWWPRADLAALSADLPAVRSAELAAALGEATRYRRALVSDHSGDGTTLLTARAGTALAPSYGRGSRHRHLASGARELDAGDWPGLRHDVDTPGDLELVRGLGAGQHTSAVIRRLLPAG